MRILRPHEINRDVHFGFYLHFKVSFRHGTIYNRLSASTRKMGRARLANPFLSAIRRFRSLRSNVSSTKKEIWWVISSLQTKLEADLAAC